MITLLSDRDTYEETSFHYTSSIQIKMNKMVSNWEKENRILPSLGKKLRTYNGIPARLYGSPKVHKIDVPLRPIVSCIGVPTYELASFLSGILGSFVGKTNSAIKHSLDFVSKIRNISLPSNYILVTLDVVSLFTNVDNNLVINLIERNWKDIEKLSGTKLTKTQFLEAISLITDNCYFTFNDKIYKQKFGSPMGSPISPVLANLVMEYVEEEIIKSLDFVLPFYFRYVDDIIVAIPADKVDSILNSFNAFPGRIKFTLETEKNRCLPFLDVLISRNVDGTLSTDVYHKPTWTGRYMDFRSSLPLNYKRNTVSILADKILQLSDPKFHNKNFKSLKDVLIKNNYPSKFIDNVFRNCIFKNRQIPGNNLNINTVDRYISIPYVRVLFEKIKQLLQNYNLKTVGVSKNNLKLGLFTKLKDKIPLRKESNVVYQIDCECGSRYIGETKQWMEKRFFQHVHDSKKISIDDDTNKSALSNHLHKEKHKIKIEDVKILEHESNTKKREILEMIHIKRNSGCMNKQTDTLYLSSVYDNIVK